MSTAPLQILNLSPGTGHISSGLITVNDLTYVAIEENDYLYPDEEVRDRHLLVLDGTVDGTRTINHTGALLSIAGNIGNQLYFFTYQQGSGTTPGGAYLWVTDGTDGGTRRLSGPNPGTYQDLRFKLESRQTSVFDGKLVFSFGTDGAFEPWISDGTRNGTRALGDLQPNTPFNQGSDPNNFAVLGDRLLFSAQTDTTGREFWVSDGTPGGTQLLLDIAEADASSYPTIVGRVGDRLIFAATDEASGRELWVTDGTAAGTQLLIDINPGPDSLVDVTRWENAYTADGRMLFFANDGEGLDLWITNGTPGGTQKLSDTNIYDLMGVGTAPAGDKVFFAGMTFLGVTDGTVAGTHHLADVYFELVDRPPNYTSVVPAILDGKAIFRSDTDAAGGSELWISDGTTAGTHLLKDLKANGSSRPFDFYTANGKVFFNANYNELWVTDGTTAGTRRLMAGVSSDDFFEAVEGNPYYETIPSGFTPLDGNVYFKGYDLAHGFELWQTDGTAAGTSLVADLTPGAEGSYPRGLSVVNGQLMFETQNGVWVVDPGSEPVLSGAGGRQRFTIRAGDGTVEIANFGGYGTGSLSAAERNELDALKLIGSGLDAQRMVLQQQGADLSITFAGVANTRILLQDFDLEDLENAGSGLGNIIFNGQSQVRDSFDVFDANSSQQSLWRRDTVTFLNDRANRVRGFQNSDDVINGQNGADWLDGRSGEDTLRGGQGSDTLVGGEGNDRLVGGNGADEFRFVGSQSFRQARLGVDAILDFEEDAGDRIRLDKTVFSQLQSRAGNGLRSSEFATVSQNSAAARSGALIVYNTSNGNLFYNANGSQSGFGSGGQFAVLTGSPDLSRNGFVIQA